MSAWSSARRTRYSCGLVVFIRMAFEVYPTAVYQVQPSNRKVHRRTLFVPQRDEWIDTRSASRRNVTCQQGDAHEQQRYAQESERIRGADTVKHALHQAR